MAVWIRTRFLDKHLLDANNYTHCMTLPQAAGNKKLTHKIKLTHIFQVYRMANVMADCGGLDVMLSRFASIADIQYSRPLLSVLLKLMGHCIRVRKNRAKLIGCGGGSSNPSTPSTPATAYGFRAIPVLLHCLKMSLAAGIPYQPICRYRG